MLFSRPLKKTLQHYTLMAILLHLHHGTTFDESSICHHEQSPCNHTRFPNISVVLRDEIRSLLVGISEHAERCVDKRGGSNDLGK